MGKEEEGLSEKLKSRRKALKTLGVFTALSPFILGSVFGTKSANSPSDLELPVDSRVTGVIPNCLYLPYEKPEIQERMIQNLPQWGANCVRVFIDDRFEPKKVGDYQYYPLEQVARTSRLTPLHVDLFDGYHLLHKANPNSPYLGRDGRSLPERQMDILLNPQTMEAMAKRLRTIVSSLRGESGIWAYTLGNELNLRRPVHEQIARARGRSLASLHTDLFEHLIENVLSVDNSKPILIGVDDPNLVEEARLARFSGKVYNTLHVYPGPLHQSMVREYTSNSEHYLPLVCQEVGYSRSLLHLTDILPSDEEYDEVLSKFLQSVLSQLHDDIIALGPWRLTAPGDTHNDGYEINLSKMVKTAHILDETRIALAV